MPWQWWLQYKDSKWRDLSEELRRRIQSASLPNQYDREALLNHTVGRRIVKPFLAETIHADVLILDSFDADDPITPKSQQAVRHAGAMVGVEIVTKPERVWQPSDGLAAREM